MPISQFKWSLTFIILNIFQALSAENSFIVENLNEKFRIDRTQVNCMCQDSIGFIWFGMGNGLYKFDNSTFKYIKSADDDVFAYPDIRSIVEYKCGVFLIGTYDYGFLIYNSILEKFYEPKIESEYDFSKIKVKCIVKEESGIIWIGTKTGLFKLKEIGNKAETFEVLSFFSHRNPDSTIAEIMDIKVSPNGEIWFLSMSAIGTIVDNTEEVKMLITTEANTSFVFVNDDEILVSSYGRGLSKFNVESFAFYPNWKFHAHEDIRGKYIYKDDLGNFWLSIANQGLFLLDSTYRKNNSKPISDIGNISSDVILFINESRDGTLYICSEAGINAIYNKDKKFQSVPSSFNKNPDFHYGIRAISALNEEEVLVGTMGAGLLKTNLRTGQKTKVPLLAYHNDTAKNIQAMIKDHNGDFWIGTEGDGVFHISSEIDKSNKDIPFVNYRAFPEPFPENTVLNDFIMCLLEDNDSNLWIGTWYGLSLLKHSEIQKPDQSKAKITNFFNDPRNDSSLSSNTIMCMLQDKNNTLWIGTENGLNKVAFYQDKYFFDNHITDEGGNSLVAKSILAIHQAENGDIWFSTRDGGICLLNPTLMTFTVFNLENGFINHVVNSIAEDSDGNLWLGTGDGICKYNPESKAYNIYKKEDGLITNFLLINAITKFNNKLIFGGDKGIIYFSPEEIKRNTYKKNLVFTDIKIFNESLKVTDKHSTIIKNVSYISELELKYKQNFITFEFTSLNYNKQKDIQYSCILEGLENSWTNLGTEHKIAYTNLKHGYYTFRVLAYDSGVRNKTEEISIKVRIRPPFWKTHLAYVIYIVFFLLITFYIYWYFLNQEKKKSAIALERLNNKKEHEIDLMKLRFFMNISHEFRTPLTLISAPLESLISGTANEAKRKSYYNIMLQNSNKLKRLVDELLELRKIDAGFLKMSWKVGNIIFFIKNIFDTFQNYADKRNMQLVYRSSIDELTTYFDSDKLDKVIFNLLSNAFKYTENGGKIVLIVDYASNNKGEDNLRIRIKDTGVGIPESMMGNLFQRFQNVDEIRPVDSASTGIGLSLVKELIDLHKGRIEVESIENVGSTFCVYIPIYKTKPDTDVSIEEEYSAKNKEYGNEQAVSDIEEGVSLVENKEHKPILLLVEDNEDLRGFIDSELKADFEIYQGENGEEGLELALQKIPDLVVTDIMMDKMDGITFCKRLKNDEKTSHIPVVLLTARHADNIQLDGFQTGADAYITKPFNIEILRSRIISLINQRRKLSAKFSHGVESGTIIETTNTLDSQFIEKLERIINDNIEKVDFDSTKLASEMAMSRMQLYRKLKALTNQTVNNYIKNIRLNKAANLLLTTKSQISEIAYLVGFTEPSNFTKSFKQHFKQPPSQFIESHKKIT